MKKILFLLLILLIIPISVAKANNVQINKSIYIAKGEITTESLFAIGNTVTINGTVSGDAIIIAKNININGRIDGDLIAISANNININGSIGGNVRTISQSITINNFIARNISVIASTVELTSDSTINWDSYIIANEAKIQGVIKRNLKGIIKQLIITGEINNVDVKTKDSLVIEQATINGQLTYVSDHTANISIETKLKSTPTQIPWPKKNTYWTWWLLFKILSTLVVAITIALLGKKYLYNLTKIHKKKIKKALLPGIIITLIVPPLVIILSLSIIAIPLAIIILVLWLVLIYLAKVLTAIYSFYFIFSKLKLSNSFIPALIVGITIFWLIFALPYIGCFIALLSTFFGAGLIWSYVKNKS